MYLRTHTCPFQKNKENESMDLKERKGYLAGFGGRKERRKWYNFMTVSTFKKEI